MSFEHMPPAVLPDTAKDPRHIDFDLMTFTRRELPVAMDIAINSVGGDDMLSSTTIPQAMDTLSQLERVYTARAIKQSEPVEVVSSVHAAFAALRVTECESRKGEATKNRKKELSVLWKDEQWKGEFWWQVYCAEYLTTLNEVYEPREAEHKAADFWEAQAVYWRGSRDKASLEKFEAYKVGILRVVALEHIMRHLNGWKIQEQNDPKVDLQGKIDIVAKSDSGRTFLIQLKGPRAEDLDTLRKGWFLDEVRLNDRKEYAYLGEFQQGLNDYVRNNGIVPATVTGAYVEFSITRGRINKATGLPESEFAKEVGAALVKLDTPIS